jgi:vitamin B12 transport system permease protein
MTARKLLGELFALLCSVMLGLAAGAVWLVPTLYLRRPLPVLALAFGWLLALAIRYWVYRGQRGRIVLSGIATIVSIVYMCMLVAAVNIAASMDVGLIDSMRTAGAGMLLQLAHMGVHAGDIGWFLAGIALSVFTAAKNDKRAT